MNDIAHLVSLGSSYAAGPGIDPVIEPAAGRSSGNYPHLLAARLGARLTDLTVSGATTETILTRPQRTGLRTVFPPQVDGIPPDADLVTVTAGGNDLHYLQSMIRAGMAGRLGSRRSTRALGVLLGRPPVSVLRADAQHAADGLVRIVDAVRSRTPAARVVLVDYLTVIGPDTRADDDLPLTVEDMAALRTVKAQLNEVFETAAHRSGAELVQVSRPSGDHALGSAEPWVRGMQPLRRIGSSFHPNAAGMRAVADEIHRHLTP